MLDNDEDDNEVSDDTNFRLFLDWNIDWMEIKTSGYDSRKDDGDGDEKSTINSWFSH